jgi:hypothetical protein
MAYSDSKSIAVVIQEFQIRYLEADFVSLVEFAVSSYFRSDLETVVREGIVDNSEFAICENLIYPILKEVWKQHRSNLVIWNHESLTCDEKLTGFPEYIVARRSPLGKVVFDKPIFMVVEAKQDKFEEGWGQCLAEMVAAQKLNDAVSVTVFGIVSNGKLWQFGKLAQDIFTRNITFYSIQDLDELLAGVCKIICVKG